MSDAASGRARPAAIAIPRALLEQTFRHARATFPDECCGWLSGPRDGAAVATQRRAHNAYSPEAHPTADDRTAETAYVIEGDELLELARDLDDSPTPPRVLYHSHPNGRAYFSATDKRVALDPWGSGPMYPVQQLVVGIDAQRVVEAKLFAWDGEDFVEVAAYEGDEI